MSYNLKNFLSQPVYTKGEKTGSKFKPSAQVQALVKIITKVAPEVLGICEIGKPEDFQYFRSLLAQNGLTYPYTEYVQAGDSIRHLALLSQHKISASHSHSNLSYRIGDSKFPLRRGVLHVEIELKLKTLHALGVHFKSKRPTQEADQALMRLKEATLVRDIITRTLTKNPNALFFAYGDFNDTFKSKTIKVIKGFYHSPTRLTPLDLHDRRGEYWTHYWQYQRSYSVLDYIFCNDALLPYVKEEKSYIFDSSNVLTASDHRPLVVVFDF